MTTTPTEKTEPSMPEWVRKMLINMEKVEADKMKMAPTPTPTPRPKTLHGQRGCPDDTLDPDED
jgi:hypothetical protein